MRHGRVIVGTAVTALIVVASPATASAGGGGHDDDHGGGRQPVTTVATGLDDPFQLSTGRGGELLVAESSSGEVSSVDRRTGAVTTLVGGLGSPTGVDDGRRSLFISIGGPAPDAPPSPPGTPSAALVEAGRDGQVLRTWDLLAYELATNPDGQAQFLPDGSPADALSNPFSVLVQRDRVLVADAGANAVLAVDRRTGAISTFFVPPVVTDVPGCTDAPNNPGTVGCDPVPTEITEGPDGRVYVGTLGAEVPGAGRVYVLGRTGRVLDQITGLTSVTGVAVGDRGTVYVSNVLEGAPAGDPPADFDPSTVGQLTRISRDGSRAVAEVPMPTGLEVVRGQLYASAWSIAGLLLQQPGRGEVVRVADRAFTPVS